MRRAFRWLIGNLGLLLLSLILALLVWLAAVEQGNPTIERRYSSPVPVRLSAPPEGMVAYGQTNAQVQVTLRAPESVWQDLQPEQIHAVADISHLGPGSHQVPVQVEVDRRPVMVREVDPETILIHLELAEVISVPVRVRLEGDVALGYIARQPEVIPSIVVVSGPASLVTRVVEAVAVVSVDGARADIQEEFVLQPFDEEGQPVPYVSLIPGQATVYVPVEQLSGFRDLAVTALLEGQVAPGYRISGITVNPPVVTAYGPPDLIAQIPGYLETKPLNLEGAQGDVEMRLPILVPEGVSLLMEEPVVAVRVFVEPLVGSLTVERPVEVQGLAQPGITATVAPMTVQVILSGPLPVLDQLKDEDVRVIVDLFGLNPGSHSVEPKVVAVPAGVTAQSVLPSTIQVEVRVEPTPTPRRSP